MENFKAVYVDVDVYEALKSQADKTNQTMNGLLKGVVEVIEYLDEAEEASEGGEANG